MDSTMKTNVETLIKKAAEATTAADAVNFAQAACNASKALQALDDIERHSK